MHVAFWSPGWPLEKFQNGIVTCVHWMRRELEEQGHRVSVFTDAYAGSRTDQRIYQIPFGLRDRIARKIRELGRFRQHDVFDHSAAIAAAISRVHRRDPIDVLEMEESFGWFADIAKRTAVPLLVKLHGPAFLSLVDDELNTPFGQEKVEREGRALRLATAIAAPSKVTLASTIERYHLRPRETQVIGNPLAMNPDTPIWRLDRCERDTILFVGRFDLPKGADVLLKAFQLILQTHPQMRLIFVGPDRGWRGPSGGQVQFESYCDELFSEELRGRVDYRGPMPNSEIARLRAQAMVTVVASRWESQGYTALEAMYQGCPLVSTDAGGCREIVTDGKTGRLAKSGNPNDFASKISALLDDANSAERLGRSARQYVVEEFSPAKIVARSLAMYEKVIARR